MFNCTSYYLDIGSNFSKPMPWIGLYIAAASLCCAILVLTDYVDASRRKQTWIPCRYFSLNASSLTILAVAIKLSVDLNTSLPRRTDQLAKISTSVLVCISMVHLFPSLGKMGDADLLANLIALVILIITTIVNLCIQLRTGVIYAFIEWHILYLASMIYLLMAYCCTAIALASIKNELRGIYDCKQKIAMNACKNENGSTITNKQLEKYVVKFSIISHTGSPHFVLGRSILCSTSAFISLVDVIIFSFLLFPYYQRKILPFSKFRINHDTFCNYESDYAWSTSVVFVTQFAAISVGSLAIFHKLLVLPKTEKNKIATRLRKLKKVEKYWTQWLIEIRQRPFFFYIRHDRCRKYVHHGKKIFCNIFIAIQIAMVMTIKVFGFIYDTFVADPLSGIFQYAFAKLNLLNYDAHPISRSIANSSELQQCVLFLDGEEEIIEPMLRTALSATGKCIEEGKMAESADLLNFLKTSRSPGFPGVFLFDSNRVPHFYFGQTPPNCWSLSVVTLTSLAVLLPGIDQCKAEKLLKAVGEGLVFIKKIEESLNDHIRFKNKRKAADIVWEDLNIHGKRLDVDLTELASIGNNQISILRFLACSAKSKFLASHPSKENTSVWPIEAVASYCLHRVCETVLLDCQQPNSPFQTTDALFDMLSSRICDILGACLTNLKSSILHECSESAIEKMNDTARRVLILFGKAEKIIEHLDAKQTPRLNPDQLAFIDEWRHVHSPEA